MSLIDRLAKVRPPSDAVDALQPIVKGPLAEIRRRVHKELQEILGPQLYGERSMDRLEQQVREILPEVLAKEEKPLTAADRSRIIGEICDEIIGHGPLEPLLSRVRCTIAATQETTFLTRWSSSAMSKLCAPALACAR